MKKDEIERLRARLNEMLESEDVNKVELIVLSQELDVLIAESQLNSMMTQ